MKSSDPRIGAFAAYALIAVVAIGVLAWEVYTKLALIRAVAGCTNGR